MSAEILARAEAEAARDRAERAHPATGWIVEARDREAAGGRFDDADRLQRSIDARHAAERAEPPSHDDLARHYPLTPEREEAMNRAEAEAEAEAQRAAERAARRQTEDRETDAQLRHDRFPFWADRDRPEPGPTDRPGLIARAHQMQGQTRDRAHWVRQDRERGDRQSMVGRTRGRGEQQR